MAETPVHLPARSGRAAWRRWLIAAVAATVLAGAGVAIALSITGGSPSSAQTPAVVSSWLQAHPDVASWMREHPGEWTWMHQHWGETVWMHERWDAMVWLHTHPGVAGTGMMSGMPMGTNPSEMRQWMPANPGAFAWMQSHWEDMSQWMSSHWSAMQSMHDHWYPAG
jgi:hypothetical protein